MQQLFSPEFRPVQRCLKILVVSDHSLARYGLRLMLNASTSHDIIEDGSPLQQLPAALSRHRPDIAIVDLSTSPESVERVRSDVVGLQGSCRFVLLCRHEDLWQWALPHAAAVSVGETATAVLEVLWELSAPGAAAFSSYSAPAAAAPAVAAKSDGEGVHVTPREREVIELITRGLCNKRIATELSISVTTVRTHRQRLMNKLGLRNSVEVAQFAARVLGMQLSSAASMPA